jgi:hypothetical protein
VCKRLLILSLLLAGCVSGGGDSPECVVLRDLAGNARYEVFRYPDGSVAARGSHLPEWRNGPAALFPPWQDVTPVGSWTYLFENGRTKATINYALACYTQCCSAGLCPHVHSYPVGEFTLWYESGALRARGAFVARREHVDTSCEGGDVTLRARASAGTETWDEQGRPLDLNLPEIIRTEFLPNGF